MGLEGVRERGKRSGLFKSFRVRAQDSLAAVDKNRKVKAKRAESERADPECEFMIASNQISVVWQTARPFLAVENGPQRMGMG